MPCIDDGIAVECLIDIRGETVMKQWGVREGGDMTGKAN